MDTIASRPSRVPWPPLIYLAAVVFGALLHAALPLPWLASPLSDMLFAFGCLAAIAAVVLDVSALRALHTVGTTVLPHRGAEHLATGGAFRLTRNPIYLAYTLFLIAFGLVAGIAWFLPLAVLAAFATRKLAIDPEEKHLALRFGRTYRDYAKRVRRWI